MCIKNAKRAGQLCPSVLPSFPPDCSSRKPPDELTLNFVWTYKFGVYSKITFSNFLQPVIPTWRTNEPVEWE